MAALSLPTAQICSRYGGVIKLGMLVPSACYCYRDNCFLNVKLTHRRRRCNYAQRLSSSVVFATSQSSTEQIEPSLDTSSDTEEPEKGFSYLFRTEIGGLVRVLVAAKSTKYVVHIGVSSLPEYICGYNLVLSWGMFRSDSSCLYVPDPQTSTSGTGKSASEAELGSMKTPFIQNSLKLDFDRSQAPFYLSFLLYLSSSDAATATDSGVRTHRKTNFCVPVGLGPGFPLPLGVTMSNDGSMNFSLFSREVESVVLCLYDGKSSQPSLEIELDPYVNRTGDIWHVSTGSVGNYVNYGYRCKGDHVLLDPYATAISKYFPDQGESMSPAKCLGCINQGSTFDWNGDVRPRLPMEKLVVYRLNVGHFTKDKSSRLSENVAGTFAGVSEKLQHFIDLGFNAVLFEPIFPFDEQKGPYFPYNFFSPMNSYGTIKGDGLSAINSMKEMVKALHAHNIEVLLEVVFSHTSEGADASCQAISFRGIDNSSYYIVNGDIGSGSNNALNCNNPIVQQMIIDSLRHWLTEFHVDGFCFINSSSLVRGPNGEYLSRPPLVEAIAFDPVLSEAKIIADCWSPVYMSCLEIQFPHWKRWAEMNTRFCSDVRNFLRGEGFVSDLATRLCGSGDLFSNSRGPAFSFNYIAKNFGLPLVDLVSFGGTELASELSWNCGDEGPTADSSVLEIRVQQIRNFLFVLFVSLGIPVLNMGDECGHSTGGSPAYTDRRPMDWDGPRTGFGMQTTQFIAFLSSLRVRRSDVFQRREFLRVESIDWQGSNQTRPKWADPSCKFLAMTLKAEKDDELSGSDPSGSDDGDLSDPSGSDDGDLFLSFNASDLTESVVLPQLSEGTMWLRLVDTSLQFPRFFSGDDDLNVYKVAGLSGYEVKPYSCTLFEAKNSSSQVVPIL